mmetsp:Transcript_16002/g.13981  ORF Transcript_16002/g.13981 Transcript_16002/m.13981 type:complete len:141 (+) Transcript_16002:270-692(+)
MARAKMRGVEMGKYGRYKQYLGSGNPKLSRGISGFLEDLSFVTEEKKLEKRKSNNKSQIIIRGSKEVKIENRSNEVEYNDQRLSQTKASATSLIRKDESYLDIDRHIKSFQPLAQKQYNLLQAFEPKIDIKFQKIKFKVK